MKKSTLFQNCSTKQFASNKFLAVVQISVLSLLLLLGIHFPMMAQSVIGNYTFTNHGTSNTYTTISSTGTALYSNSNGSSPSTSTYVNLEMPFNFVYGSYLVEAGEQIAISPSWGYVFFNPATKSNSYQPTSFTNAISPAGGNGSGYNEGWTNPGSYFYYDGTSGVYYQVSGTAPNRVLTIEFYKVSANGRAAYNGYSNYTDVNSSYTKTFQVKLYEGNSKIEFCYGPANAYGGNIYVAGSYNSNYYYYYGSDYYPYTFLKGATNTDSYYLYGPNSHSNYNYTDNWNNPTYTTNVDLGTAQYYYTYGGSGTGYYENKYVYQYSEYWTEGLKYSFTPDIPTITYSNITGSGLELSWDASNFGETSWSIEYGLKGFAPGSGTVVTTNDNSNYLLTNMPPAAEVDVYVYAFANGPFGEASAANKVTVITPCADNFYVANTETFEFYRTDTVNTCWKNLLDSSAIVIDTASVIIGYDTTYTYIYGDVQNQSIDYSYTGTPQEWTVPADMTASLEVWGAQGGYRSSSSYGGYGGYAAGTITVRQGDVLYVYVGGSGNTGGTSGGWNGGGTMSSYAGGGGGTDIRVNGTTMYYRVIVAGGGGSCGSASGTGGYGGGTSGGTGSGGYGTAGEGASLSSAGGGGRAGSFGQGASGLYQSNGYGGAGGGGWYGGGGATPDGSGDDDKGGGGGSGYVYTSSYASYYPSGRQITSDYYLTNTQIISGNASMPNPDGGTMTGRTGNGFARISYSYQPIVDSLRHITPIYRMNKYLAVYGSQDTDIVVSPTLSFSGGTALGDHLVHFDVFTKNSGAIEVGTIEGTPENPVFVPITSVTPSISNQIENFTVMLKPYTGAGSQLAFRSINADNAVDNVWMEIANQTPCAYAPMELRVVSTTSSDATLSWASGYNETNYTVEWGLGDFVQGQGNSTIINNVADTFFHLSGLQPGEEYTFYVRSNCGDTVRTEFSSISFTTECQYAIPFIENFDQYVVELPIKCWVKAGDERRPIVVASQASSSPNALAMTPPAGGDFIIRFPDLGASDVSNVVISWDAYAAAGSLIEIGYLDNGIFTLLNQVTQSQDNAWETHTVNVSGVTGKYFAIKVSEATAGSLVYVDNVVMSRCNRPTNLTVNSFGADNINLSWTAGASETDWIVKYGVQGFNPDQSGTSVTATGSDNLSFDLTGLQSNTIYNIYVQSDCGGEVSAWSTMAVCTTKNTVAQVPYNCDFENATERNAWYFTNGSGAGDNNWYISRAMYTNNGGDYGMYISKDGGNTNSYLLTTSAIVHSYREFYMPESNSYKLTFDWKSNGQSTDYLNVYLIPISQRPVVGVLPNVAYKINPSALYNSNSQWKTYTIEIPRLGYPTGYYYLCFTWVNNDTAGVQPPIAVDNISLSNCIAADNLNVTATSNTATVSWTPHGSSTNFIVEYKEESQDWSVAQTINVSSTSTTITGLTDLTLYQVRIISLCDGGNSETSEVRNFLTCDNPQITVVNGSSSTQSVPMYANADNNNFYISQSIYTPNDISATGQITEIWYNVASGSISGEGLSDVSIYMGYTNKNSFASANDWVTPSSLTEVYRGTYKFNTIGWQKIVLHTPFTYDATSNLVVATKDNDRGANASQCSFIYNSLSNSSIYQVGQTTVAYDFSSSTSGNVVAYRPAMKFTLCDPVLYCKVPTGLTATPGSSQVEVSWVTGNAETSWDLRWKKSSDTEWDTVRVYTNDTILTGLSAMATSYDVAVRAYCVDGNMSDWVSTTFTTPCGNPLSPNPNYGYTIDNPKKGTSSSYLLYNVGYYSSYGVSMYHPSDLGLEMGKPTWITHIAYRFITVQYFNPTFFMGTVSSSTTQFGNNDPTYFRNYMTNYKKVYEQPASYIHFSSGQYYNGSSSDNNWYTFELDEPYYWDGVGKIVVGCFGYGADNSQYRSNHFAETWNYTPSDGSYSYRQMWNADHRHAYCDPESYNFGMSYNWSTYAPYVPDLKLTVSDKCYPCDMATNVQISSTTNYTATFTLTDNAGVGEYEYEVGPVGFKPGDGTGTRGTTTAPYTIEPLQPNTPYDLYVRPMCDGYQDANLWSNKVSFSTQCGGQVAKTYTNARTSTSQSSNFPFWSGTHYSYSQSLYEPEELGLTRGEPRWIQGISLRLNPGWADGSYYVEPDIYFGDVPFSTTGFGDPGSKLSYLPYAQLTEVLNSKTIYYPNQNTSNPSSYPYYNNSTYWWDFQLDKPYYWDGNSNLVIGFYNGIANTTYSHIFYMHTPLVTHSYKTIGLYHNDNNIGHEYVHPESPAFMNSWSSNTYTSEVPDVRLQVYECTNSCPDVSNITAVADSMTQTSAYITWAENGTATQWQLKYRMVGGSTYTTIYPNQTGVRLSGLYTGMAYEVKVRSICYAGDTSDFVMANFTTLCQSTMNLPYNEDFNGSYGSALSEHCWDDGTMSGQGTKPTVTTSSPYAIQFPAGAASYAVSPAFNTNNIGEMFVQFKAYGNAGSSVTIVTVEDPTDLSTGVTVCGTINLTSSWADYEQSLAAYTGTTAKRIAFMSNGTLSYVDDVNIFSCRVPQNLTYSNVTSTTVDLAWQKGNVETDWEIRYSYVGSNPDLDGTGVIVPVSGNAYQGYTLALEQYLDYQIEVRAICGEYTSLYGNRVTVHTPKTPGTIPYFADFEDSLDVFGWTLNEGTTQTNEWYIGTATNNGGNHSLYISDDNGMNNAYDNTRASYSFAWRDIQFDNSLRFVLTFDWRALGATNDDIYVYLVSPTTFPQNGTYWGPGTALNATPLNGSLAWRNFEAQIDNSGGTYSNKIWRLVFMWKNNDAVGDIPPGAIDNVSISTSCFRPTDLAYSLNGNTASLNWLPGGMEESWLVRYEMNRDGQWHILPAALNNYQLPLQELTFYTVQVAARCGSDTSFWSDAVSFMVPCSNSIELTMGTSTTYSEKIPLANNTKYSYSQQIFTAYELTKSGSISKMDFYYDYAVPATAKNTNVRFYLAHSDKVQFDNTNDWIDKSEFTLVYDGTFNCTQGLNTINFTTPFEYNGDHSLVLLVEDASNNSNLNAGRYRTHTTGGINKAIYYNGSSAYIPGSTLGTLLSVRNNMHFTFCDPADICQDLENLTVSSITPTQATANWTSQGVANRWQLRYQVEPTAANGEGGAWQYVSGLAATNYTMTNLTELNDYYRVQVRGTCPAIPDTSRWTPVLVFNNGCTSPETTTYGSKQTTGQVQPIYDSTYSLTQQIYTPNEVGVSSEGGYIRSITLEKSASSISTANPTIYMGVTSQDAFTSYTSGQIIQGNDLFKVYEPQTASVTWTATTMTFTFQTPYFYNGQDNLVLAMYVGNQTTTSPSCYSTQGSQNRTAYFYCSSATNADPSSGSTLGANTSGGGISAYRSDIRFDLCVSCEKPSSITQTNATPTTATLAWTANNAETSWIVEYGAKGFVKGTGVLDTAYTTPNITLSNLVKGKYYDIYVKGQCNANLISGYASTPYTFSTLCGQVETLPWTDNMDSHVAGSGNNYFPYNGSPYNYDECWVLASGSANCSSSQHESGANSLYIYGNGSQSIAALPEFDESIENLQITFDALSTVSGSELSIGVWSELYSTFTQLHTVTISPLNAWDSYTFPFTNYGAIQDPGDRLALKVTGSYNVYLDNIVVEAIPGCQRPTQLSVVSGTENIATVDWLNHGTPDAYIVSYKEYAQGDSLWVEDYTTSKPYTFRIGWSGMEELCEVKVRAICGSDTSDWSPIQDFTTGCTYLETYTTTLTTTQGSTTTFLPSYNYGSNGIWTYSEQIYSPEDLGLTRGQPAYITSVAFRAANDYSTSSYNYIAAQIFMGLTSSDYFGASPGTQSTYKAYNNTSTTMKKYRSSTSSISFPNGVFTKIQMDAAEKFLWDGQSNIVIGWMDSYDGYSNNAYESRWYVHQPYVYSGSGSNYKSVGFTSNSGVNYVNPAISNFCTSNQYTNYSYYQPDVQIEIEQFECISCPQPSNLAIDNLGTNSIDVSWGEEGHAVRWELAYGSLGFDPSTSGVHVYSRNLNTTFTGLSEGTTYDWYVRATCDTGYVDLSNWTKGPSFTMPCGLISTLPWADNFESHNIGLFPNQANNNGCWTLDKNAAGNSYCDYGYRVRLTTQQGSTTSVVPSYNYGNNSRWTYSEQIYQPEDFGLTRGQGGYITSVAFRAANNYSTSSYNYISAQIYIGTTQDNYFTSSGGTKAAYKAYGNTTTTMKNYRSNSSSVSFTNGNFIPLDMDAADKFYWDGNSNIVIGWMDSYDGYSNNAYESYWYMHQPTIYNGSNYKSIGFTSNSGSNYVNPGNSNFFNSNQYTNQSYYQPDMQIEMAGGGTALYLNAASSGGYATALTPALNIPLNSVTVNFKAKTPNMSYRLEVGVMDVPGGTFVPVDTIRPFVTNEWEEYEVLINGVSGNNNYVAFRVTYSIAGTANTYYVDDVVIDYQPTCPRPTDFTATYQAPYRAALAWTEPGNATSWTVEYQKDNDGIWHQEIATTNPYTITGLRPATHYTFRVKSNCGTNNYSIYSVEREMDVDCHDYSSTPMQTLSTIQEGNTTYAPLGYQSYTYGYSYSEQIYEPQDFGLSRGDKLMVTSIGFRPQSFNYNYVTVNYYLGNTTSTYYSSPGYIGTQYKAYNNGLTQYRSSSSTVTSTWANGQFSMYDLNTNGNEFEWNTNQNLVVGWYDMNNSYDSYYYYNTFYCHTPARGYNGSQYRSIGLCSTNSSYVNPASNNIGGSYNSNDQTGYLPDLRITAYRRDCISCISPTTMLVDNITTTEADLTWDEAVYDWAQSYEVKYGPTGFNVNNSGTLISNILDTTYHLTGLQVSTTYDIYVRTNCEDSDNSTWDGPYTFTTNCQFTSLPYRDDFNSYPAHTSPICWIYGNTSASYPMTGALAPYTYMFETEAGTYAYTTPPELNLSGVNMRDLKVSFDAKAYRTPATIKVGVMDIAADYSTFVPVEEIHITDWALWDNYEVLMGSYTGTGKYVAIVSEDANFFEIDNFEIDYAPQACNPPSNIVLNTYDDSVGVSWNENNANNLGWQIAYGPAGFDITAGDWTYIMDVFTNPAGITGLQPSTNYDLYVRTVCAVGDTSDWSSASSFSTYCPMISSLPYVEDYNTPAPPFPPQCWQVVYGNNNPVLNPMTYGTPLYGNNTTPSYRFSSQNTTADYTQYLITPAISYTGDMELRFQYIGTRNMSNVTFSVGISNTDENIASFDWLPSVTVTGADYATWRDYIVGIASGTKYIAIKYEATAPSSFLYVDNFTLEEVNVGICDVTIGRGGSITTAMPIDAGGSYNYSYVQQLYKPEEIGIACDITDIAFRYQSTASTDAGTANLDIYMVETSQSEFTSSSSWVPVTSANRVFTGNVPIPSDGWITISLPTQYRYMGTENLAVVVHNKTGVPMEAGFWSYPTTENGAMVRRSNSTISGTAPGTATQIYNMRNHIRLTRKPIVTATPLITTVCPETPINITLSGTAGATYEWFNSDTQVGIPATGIGSIHATSQDNNQNTIRTATIKAVPKYMGCIGDTLSLTVNVQPFHKILDTAANLVNQGKTIYMGANQYLTDLVVRNVIGGVTNVTGRLIPVGTPNIGRLRPAFDNNTKTIYYNNGPSSGNILGVSGTYYVEWTTQGVGTCSTVFVDTVIITGAIHAAITHVAPQCYYSEQTGSMTITPSYGIPPYYIHVQRVDSMDAPGVYVENAYNFTASNLAAGVPYNIHIEDRIYHEGLGNLYVLDTVYTIPSADTVHAYISAQTDITCNTQGTITVKVEGGKAPYYVGMDTNTMFTTLADSTYMFTGLDNGTYTFFTRDNNGCLADSVQTSIQSLASIDVDLTVTHANCDAANGEFSFNYRSGVLPYKLTIVDRNTSNVVYLEENVMDLIHNVNLVPGQYNILIEDVYAVNPCVVVLNSEINGPSAFVAATGAKTTVNACATILGTIEVTAKGGFPPYQISLNGALTNHIIYHEEDTVMVDSLIPGTNLIEVVDACGTIYSLNPVIQQLTNHVSVYAYATLPSNATGDNICMGDSVLLTAQATSGAGGYTYSWQWIYTGESQGRTEGIRNPGSAITVAEPSGNEAYHYYFVEVRDSEGCIAVSDTFRNGIIPRNFITVTSATPASQVLCTSTSASGITVNLSSHSEMTELFWSHSNPSVGVGLVANNSAMVDTATYTIPGFTTQNNGTVIMVDTITIWTKNAHCEGSSVQVVIEVQPRHTIALGSDTTICAEAPATFTHVLGGGAQNVTVSWQGNDGGLTATVNNGVVTFTGAPATQGTYIATLTTTGNGTCTVSTKDTIVARQLPIASANQGSNIYCPRDREPIYLTVTPVGITRVWTLVNNPNPTTAPTPVIVYPNAYDSSYAGVYSVVVTQNGCIATATVDVWASCSSAPGANSIAITQNGSTVFQGSGVGQYAITGATANYSDDIQIVLSDPRVAKYVSDTCGFEYSINGGAWTVWSPTTTPIVIDATDLSIGQNVVLMRHDTTCAGESLLREYIFTITGSSDSLAHTPTIVAGEVCHTSTGLVMNDISIRGFDPSANRYEWMYEYQLQDTTITNGWTILAGTATPEISVNNTPDNSYTTETGDVITVSLRVAYISSITTDTLGVTDTIWLGTAEVQEVYTVRANPWLTLSDTTVCMIEDANFSVDFTEQDAPMIGWQYQIEGEAGYTSINNAFGFLNNYAATYEMTGAVNYANAKFTDFDKSFDTLNLIVSLTTGNPTCPVAYDSAVLTLLSAHTLVLQTQATDNQTICYSDQLTPIEYVFGNGADSVSVSWDIVPANVQMIVSGDTLTMTGTAPVGVYHYTVTTIGNCETTTAVGQFEVKPLPVFTIAGQGPSCQAATDGFANVVLPGGQPDLPLYSFVWTDGQGEVISNSFRIMYQGVGTYTVNVTTRATGCVATDSITLVAPDTVVTAQLLPINATCYGTASGSLEVIPSMGSGLYTIELYNSLDVLVGDTQQVLSNNAVLFANLFAGTYKVVIIDGQCGFEDYVTITEPQLLTAVISDTTGISCVESSDGTATVTISGGTAPYDIVWRDAANNIVSMDTTLSNMVPGILYTVTVTDDYHCGQVQDAIMLTAPDSIVMYISDVACNSYTWNSQTYTTDGTYTQLFPSMNGCDSLVHLNLTFYYNQTGEMWDYACEPTYTWSLNNETYTTSGDYVDTIFGGTSHGCDSIVTLHLLLPDAALSMDLSVDSVLCNGESNGVITVLGEDGIPLGVNNPTPINPGLINFPIIAGHYNLTLYDASNSIVTLISTVTITVSQPYSITGLPAGSYIVVLQDSICTISDTIDIYEPAVLTSSIVSAIDAACYGTMTGEVEVQPIGGTTPYSYDWQNSFSMTVSTGAAASSLTAGTYNVTITDVNGCTTTNSVTLTQPDSVKSYISDYGCYSYTWTGATNQTYTQSGEYVHTYPNATVNGCDSTVFLTLTIYNPLYDTTAVTLCGGTNGSTYVWTTPENVSRTLTAQGVYYDTVFNVVGCDSLIHVLDLTIPTDTMISQVQISPVSCYNVGDGIMTLTVTGGNAPYDVLLSTGASATTVSSSQAVPFTGLVQGTYTAVITDAGGCTSTAQGTVVQPDSLHMREIAHSDALCYQTATGSSTVEAYGGNTTFTYVWTDSNAQVISNISSASNLLAGVYEASVTDENGCTASLDITITQPDEIATSIIQVSCDSFRWTAGNNVLYTANDTVSYVYQSVNGCDSTVTMYLFIGSTGSSFPANCPNDTMNIAPYGVCTMPASDVIFPVPTFDPWLQHYVDTMYHDGPAVYVVDSTYTITWTIEYFCGVPRTCTQLVTIAYPPCGFENGSMYTVTDAEGNVYNTVRIGCDCWMAENLASTTYSDTTCGLSNSPIAVALAYYAALYPDTVANVNTYGRLYSWYSAVGLPEGSTATPCLNSDNHITGACPAGWYLPSDEDYLNLYSYGMANLMSPSGWLYSNGTNGTGFTALPGGYYNAQAGEFYNLIGNGYFWSSQETTILEALNCEMTYSCPDATLISSSRHNGYSVRCIKE